MDDIKKPEEQESAAPAELAEELGSVSGGVGIGGTGGRGLSAGKPGELTEKDLEKVSGGSEKGCEKTAVAVKEASKATAKAVTQ